MDRRNKMSWMSAVGCASVGLMVAGATTQAADAATVAHWRFENTNSSEVGGAGLDYTSGPGVGFSSQIPGTGITDPVAATTVGNVATYDPGTGPSALNQAAVSAALNPVITGGSDFTIETFVRLNDGAATPSFAHFIGNSAAGPNSGWYFSFNGTGRIEFGAVSSTGTEFSPATAASTLSNDEWHHVAAVGDYSVDGSGVGSTTVSIYLNGLQSGSLGVYQSTAGAGPVMKENSTSYILGALNGGFNLFDGQFDELRISNQALAPSEFLQAVPEPASLGLLLGGLALLSTRRRH